MISHTAKKQKRKMQKNLLPWQMIIKKKNYASHPCVIIEKIYPPQVFIKDG